MVLTVVDGFFIVSRICNSKHNLHLASHDDNDSTQLFPEQLNVIYDSKCSVCQWEVDYLQSQMEEKKNLESSWFTSFLKGIKAWTSDSKTISVVCDSDKEETTSRTSKVDIEIISLKHPILILSGATPGPFYHSHPHVSTEFDHLDFSMEEQVKSNIEVIRKIANTVQEYNRDDLLPFSLPLPSDSLDENYFKGIESPQLIHWISNDKEDINYPCGYADYQSRLQVVNDATDKSCRDQSMNSYSVLEKYETGNNVSDRRFRLETFAMFGIEEGTSTDGEHTFVQLDMRDILDPQYFMPYVPSYAITGGKLAMFKVTSNSGGKSSKEGDQVKLAYDNMISVLSKLDATFDNVVMIWNRVKDLDKNERSVLMTRSEIMGWDRPLAESVLEINGVNDIIQGIDERTGQQLYIELIVVAQLPS